NQHDETVSLVKDLITVTGTATITDKDGDTDTHSTTAEVGDAFIFTDHGPSVGSTVDGQVDEAGLTTGSDPDANKLSASGSLGVTHSADGSDARFTQDTLDDLLAKGWQSGGEALDYSLDASGHTLTATAGGNPVFTVTITDPSNNNSGYEFELQGPLDHAGADELDLEFSFVVTDGDDDTAG